MKPRHRPMATRHDTGQRQCRYEFLTTQPTPRSCFVYRPLLLPPCGLLARQQHHHFSPTNNPLLIVPQPTAAFR